MSPEQVRIMQIALWMLFNIISVTVAAKDLRDARRVRNFVRDNYATREDITATDRMIVYRSRRLALHRMGMAVLFLLAGLDATLGMFGILDIGWTAYFLIAAAILLSVDVLYENRYRRHMFHGRNVDLE